MSMNFPITSFTHLPEYLRSEYQNILMPNDFGIESGSFLTLLAKIETIGDYEICTKHLLRFFIHSVAENRVRLNNVLNYSNSTLFASGVHTYRTELNNQRFNSSVPSTDLVPMALSNVILAPVSCIPVSSVTPPIINARTGIG